MQLSGKVEVRVDPVGDPYNGCADELFSWSWLNRHPFDWRGSNEMHFNPAGSSGPLPVSTCPRCLVAKVPRVDCGPLKIPRRLVYLTPFDQWPGIIDMPFVRADPYEDLTVNSVILPGQDIPHDNVVEHDGWGWENRSASGGQALHKYCLYSPVILRDAIIAGGMGGLGVFGAARLWGNATFRPCDGDECPYWAFSPQRLFAAYELTYWHITWDYQGADLYNASLSINSVIHIDVDHSFCSLVRRLRGSYSDSILSVENVTEPDAYRLFNDELTSVRELTLSLQQTTGEIEDGILCGLFDFDGEPFTVTLPESIALGAA